MVGGFTGTGVKTIVPAKATAKFVCRLVPNQDPDAVLKVLTAPDFAHVSISLG